jgi:hypothetical protein
MSQRQVVKRLKMNRINMNKFIDSLKSVEADPSYDLGETERRAEANLIEAKQETEVLKN